MQWGWGPLSHIGFRWANCWGYGQQTVLRSMRGVRLIFVLIWPLQAVRIENMELTENILLHCSSLGESHSWERDGNASLQLHLLLLMQRHPQRWRCPRNMKIAHSERMQMFTLEAKRKFSFSVTYHWKKHPWVSPVNILKGLWIIRIIKDFHVLMLMH